MSIELYDYLRHTLGDNASVIIRISEIEALGGEDWLLEVSAQAERLKVQVMPHPQDFSLIVVERDGN